MRSYGFVSVAATKALALVQIAYPRAKVRRIGPDTFSVTPFSVTEDALRVMPAFNVIVTNGTVTPEETTPDGQDQD